VITEAPRHEDILGEWSSAPHMLNISYTWRWVINPALRPVYPRWKSSRPITASQ